MRRLHAPLWLWTLLYGVGVLVLAVGVVWGSGVVEGRLEAGTARSLTHQVRLLALTAKGRTHEEIAQTLADAGRLTGSRFRHVGEDGTHLAGRTEGPDASEDLRSRALSEGLAVQVVKASPAWGAGDVVVVAVPAPGGLLVGTRAPEASIEAVLSVAPELLWTVPLGTLLLVLVSLGASLVLTRSLGRLRVAGEILGNGRVLDGLDDLLTSRLNEVRGLARSLATTSRRLHERLAYNEQLAAHLVHEVRTPLSTLRGAMELLEDPTLPEEDRVRLLRRGHTQLTRLGGLLDGLLALTRAEREPRTADVDLRALAEEAAAAHAGVVVEGDPVNVRGDADQLRVALENLVRNALVHGVPPVVVRVHEAGPDALVEVEDQGPGIPPADRERVFQRFFTTRRGEHLGLGLPLVVVVVENHGGSVQLVETSSGTCFRVRCPKRPAAPLPHRN